MKMHIIYIYIVMHIIVIVHSSMHQYNGYQNLLSIIKVNMYVDN